MNTAAVPNGWRVTTLGDVTEAKVDQGGPTSSEFMYVDISSIDNGTKRITDPKTLAATAAPSRARQRLRAGDVIVSMTRPNLNAVALVPPELDGAIGSTGFHVLRARGVEPKWLYYAVRSPDFIESMSRLVQGALYPAVRPKDVRAHALVLPPEPEQRRIVAEIEKQFTRLDAGVEALRRLDAHLGRYRAAVLTAACGGRLIQAEMVNDEHGSSASLPFRWAWVPLPELGELNRGKSKHRPRDDARLYGGKYPFIQTGDVKNSGGSITSHTQTYSEFGLSQSRLWPSGTLCITIAANIAETGILTFPACFPDSVVGFIADESRASVRYVEMFFRTAKQDLTRFAPATAQKNINLETLRRVMVPLPPRAEQDEIVSEVERRFSVVAAVENATGAGQLRAVRLRSAVLRAAFEGRLVTADQPPRATAA